MLSYLYSQKNECIRRLKLQEQFHQDMRDFVKISLGVVCTSNTFLFALQGVDFLTLSVSTGMSLLYAGVFAYVLKKNDFYEDEQRVQNLLRKCKEVQVPKTPPVSEAEPEDEEDDSEVILIENKY